MSLRAWLRSVALLRDPGLLRRLRALVAAEAELDALRSDFPGVKIHPDVLVQGLPQGRMLIARGVAVEKGSVICLGDDFNGYGSLEVGEGTWIGQYNNLRTAGGLGIRIGVGCLVSQFCSIVAANHQMARGKRIKDQPADATGSGVRIGDDVWLGAGVSVMPSIEIGDGAVVGAGSVVTQSIPDYEIWAGVPARKLGVRS